MSLMSKVSRGKKGEAKVSSVLKKLPGAYFVFDDVVFENASSKMTHQIDHILIHPHGLFVIETKNYFGFLEYDEGSRSWSKTIRGKKIRIGNPLYQNKSHAITLRKALKSKYKPIPVVVFVKDNAPYLGDENVINFSDLGLFIESYPYESAYSPNEMAEVKALIEKTIVPISNKEHVQNIGTMKKVRKELEAEMTYAIEQGKCPWCDSPIVVKGSDYHCSKCDYHFKL